MTSFFVKFVPHSLRYCKYPLGQMNGDKYTETASRSVLSPVTLGFEPTLRLTAAASDAAAVFAAIAEQSQILDLSRRWRAKRQEVFNLQQQAAGGLAIVPGLGEV